MRLTHLLRTALPVLSSPIHSSLQTQEGESRPNQRSAFPIQCTLAQHQVPGSQIHLTIQNDAHLDLAILKLGNVLSDNPYGKIQVYHGTKAQTFDGTHFDGSKRLDIDYTSKDEINSPDEWGFNKTNYVHLAKDQSYAVVIDVAESYNLSVGGVFTVVAAGELVFEFPRDDGKAIWGMSSVICHPIEIQVDGHAAEAVWAAVAPENRVHEYLVPPQMWLKPDRPFVEPHRRSESASTQEKEKPPPTEKTDVKDKDGNKVPGWTSTKLSSDETKALMKKLQEHKAGQAKQNRKRDVKKNALVEEESLVSKILFPDAKKMGKLIGKDKSGKAKGGKKGDGTKGKKKSEGAKGSGKKEETKSGDKKKDDKMPEDEKKKPEDKKKDEKKPEDKKKDGKESKSKDKGKRSSTEGNLAKRLLFDALLHTDKALDSVVDKIADRLPETPASKWVGKLIEWTKTPTNPFKKGKKGKEDKKPKKNDSSKPKTEVDYLD